MLCPSTAATASMPNCSRILVPMVCRNWFGDQRWSLCHFANARRCFSLNLSLRCLSDSSGFFANSDGGKKTRSHARCGTHVLRRLGRSAVRSTVEDLGVFPEMRDQLGDRQSCIVGDWHPATASEPLTDQPIIEHAAGFAFVLAKVVIDAIKSDDRLSACFVLAVFRDRIFENRHGATSFQGEPKRYVPFCASGKMPHA